MKSRNKIRKLLLLVLFLILGISVAYAVTTLTATLTVTTSSVKEAANTWNIAFNGSSATGTKGGTSTDGITCGAATISGTTVTVAATTLTKPNDSCTYALTIKNTGSIDATLASIKYKTTSAGTYTNGSTFTNDKLTYGLYTENTGTTALTTGGTLAKSSGTLNLYLVIRWTNDSLAGTEVTQSGASFQLVYNQK